MDFIRVFIDENRDRQWLFFGENTVKNTFLCYYRKKIKKKIAIKIVDFQRIKTDGENEQVFGENEQVKKKCPF